MNDILAIDIGNTNITMGLFSHDTIVKKTKTPTGLYSRYESALRGFLSLALTTDSKPLDIVISSVVPFALPRLVVALNKLDNHRIHIIGRDIRAPIKNLYRAKKEVGQDRLVNAYAAKTLYGAPSVVIDFGTAITFDVVSVKGEYLGGLIFPGIELSLKSLHKKTALLPSVELKPAHSIIGRNTEDSMRGGILFGLGAMCDSLSSKYRKLLGKKTKIIATGGNAKLIKRYAKSIQIVDGDLTLKGLGLILRAK